MPSHFNGERCYADGRGGSDAAVAAEEQEEKKENRLDDEYR